MANKVKLGNRPETFVLPVTFPLVEGGEGCIKCEFKYRTKTEFGEFIDQIVSDAKADPATVADEFSMADLMAKTRDKNADYLLEVLKGWDLDAPLNRESAKQFADEYPGGAAEVMEKYRKATVEGRLGN